MHFSKPKQLNYIRVEKNMPEGEIIFAVTLNDKIVASPRRNNIVFDDKLQMYVS